MTYCGGKGFEQATLELISGHEEGDRRTVLVLESCTVLPKTDPSRFEEIINKRLAERRVGEEIRLNSVIEFVGVVGKSYVRKNNKWVRA